MIQLLITANVIFFDNPSRSDADISLAVGLDGEDLIFSDFSNNGENQAIILAEDYIKIISSDMDESGLNTIINPYIDNRKAYFLYCMSQNSE